MPCRPGGYDQPQECCRFNVVNDPEEDQPEVIDEETCGAYQDEAKTIYLGHSTDPKTSIAKTCEEVDGHQKYPTINCQPIPGLGPNAPMFLAPDKSVYARYDADKYSLWTQCE